MPGLVSSVGGLVGAGVKGLMDLAEEYISARDINLDPSHLSSLTETKSFAVPIPHVTSSTSSTTSSANSSVISRSTFSSASLIQVTDIPSGWIHLQSTYLDDTGSQKKVRCFGLRSCTDRDVEVEISSDLNGQVLFWLGEDEQVSSSASSTSSLSNTSGTTSLVFTLPAGASLTVCLSFQANIDGFDPPTSPTESEGGYTPRLKPALSRKSSSERSSTAASLPSDKALSDRSSYSSHLTAVSRGVAPSARKLEPVHKAFPVHGSISVRANLVPTIADDRVSQSITVPFFATVCRSLFTAALIDPETGLTTGQQQSSGELCIDFGPDPVVGGEYNRDILLVNRSEIELVWTTAVVSCGQKEAIWLSLRDLDSENVFGVDRSSQPVPLPALSSRHLRLALRVRAPVPEFEFDFVLANIHQSGNVVTCKVIGSSRSAANSDLLRILSGTTLDFGQICDGLWARKIITCKNAGDKSLDVHFSATPGYEVVFRLAGIAGEDLDEDSPMERPSRLDQRSSERFSSAYRDPSRGRPTITRAASPSFSGSQPTSILKHSSGTSSIPISSVRSEAYEAEESQIGSFPESSDKSSVRDLSQPSSRPLSRATSRASSVHFHTDAAESDEEDNETPFFGADSLQPTEESDAHARGPNLPDSLSERNIPDQIEEIIMRPGTEYRISVIYRPARDTTNAAEIAGALRETNFQVFLDSNPSHKLDLITRRTINCTSESCTSIISVAEMKIDFGEVTVGANKSTLLHISNLSALSAKVEIAAISKVLSANRNVIVIPPFETVEDKLDFFPRRINDAYEKQIVVRNLLNRFNDQIIQVRSKNIDRHNVTLHSHLYKIYTPSGSNFLDFGSVVINSPTVRTVQFENLSSAQLILELTASQPEDVELYVKCEDAPARIIRKGKYADEGQLSPKTSSNGGGMKERFMESLHQLDKDPSLRKPKKEVPRVKEDGRFVGIMVADALRKNQKGRQVVRYGCSMMFKDKCLLEDHEYLDLATGPPISGHRIQQGNKKYTLLESIEQDVKWRLRRINSNRTKSRTVSTKDRSSKDKERKARSPLLKPKSDDNSIPSVPRSKSPQPKSSHTSSHHKATTHTTTSHTSHSSVSHHTKATSHHQVDQKSTSSKTPHDQPITVSHPKSTSQHQTPHEKSSSKHPHGQHISVSHSQSTAQHQITDKPRSTSKPPHNHPTSVPHSKSTVQHQVTDKPRSSSKPPVVKNTKDKSPALTGKTKQSTSHLTSDTSKMSLETLLQSFQSHDLKKTTISQRSQEEEEGYVRKIISLKTELENVISSGKIVPARLLTIPAGEKREVILIMTPNGSTRPHVTFRAKRADSRIYIKLVEFDKSMLVLADPTSTPGTSKGSTVVSTSVSPTKVDSSASVDSSTPNSIPTSSSNIPSFSTQSNVSTIPLEGQPSNHTQIDTEQITPTPTTISTHSSNPPVSKTILPIKHYENLEDIEIPVRDLLLKSSCIRSILEVSQTSINFGQTEKGEIRSRTIVIQNKSDTPGIFRFRTSGSIASGDIKLGLGHYGVIPAYGRREYDKFSFTPTIVGLFQEMLVLENVQDGWNDKVLSVKAIVRKKPSFIVDPDKLEWGTKDMSMRGVWVTNVSKFERTFLVELEMEEENKVENIQDLKRMEMLKNTNRSDSSSTIVPFNKTSDNMVSTETITTNSTLSNDITISTLSNNTTNPTFSDNGEKVNVSDRINTTDQTNSTQSSDCSDHTQEDEIQQVDISLSLDDSLVGIVLSQSEEEEVEKLLQKLKIAKRKGKSEKIGKYENRLKELGIEIPIVPSTSISEVDITSSPSLDLIPSVPIPLPTVAPTSALSDLNPSIPISSIPTPDLVASNAASSATSNPASSFTPAAGPIISHTTHSDPSTLMEQPAIPVLSNPSHSQVVSAQYGQSNDTPKGSPPLPIIHITDESEGATTIFHPLTENPKPSITNHTSTTPSTPTVKSLLVTLTPNQKKKICVHLSVVQYKKGEQVDSSSSGVVPKGVTDRPVGSVNQSTQHIAWDSGSEQGTLTTHQQTGVSSEKEGQPTNQLSGGSGKEGQPTNHLSGGSGKESQATNQANGGSGSGQTTSTENIVQITEKEPLIRNKTVKASLKIYDRKNRDEMITVPIVVKGLDGGDEGLETGKALRTTDDPINIALMRHCLDLAAKCVPSPTAFNVGSIIFLPSSSPHFSSLLRFSKPSTPSESDKQPRPIIFKPFELEGQIKGLILGEGWSRQIPGNTHGEANALTNLRSAYEKIRAEKRLSTVRSVSSTSTTTSVNAFSSKISTNVPSSTPVATSSTIPNNSVSKKKSVVDMDKTVPTTIKKTIVDEGKNITIPTSQTNGETIRTKEEKRKSGESTFIPKLQDVLKDTECYATMEPCSIRTSGGPSGALGLVRAKVCRVYLGVEEPPDFVQCEGVKILETAGIEVVRVVGLEEDCLKAARRGRS
ncbi:hypothetical protein TREMEDRAFT_64643 [Tremella mesenterica DSM 1558]|uniref:uncharacterized protein n=1 Tax=Tremella mesenterica (strain ATCC 24925 / CBS 8224 / DSM 1558 / NBRC 9311 / NRRL Y-6157 / RJB 2259-6 / UBC 559-6) TaxID=578456 RepID=UPI0003F497D6|nr:uncharacterized protein TREMEDRAFT_64643 [Tremella mesenterica DSM 1558]EIW67390.1 hypothetical protein TREMEDRAFT_64643 [Tremella mesenterica DSM 1558]